MSKHDDVLFRWYADPIPPVDVIWAGVIVRGIRRNIVIRTVQCCIVYHNNVHSYKHRHRAGLRHVRSVRPNRAADFRGPPFWTLKKFSKNYVGQFEQLWCLDYGANADINNVELIEFVSTIYRRHLRSWNMPSMRWRPGLRLGPRWGSSRGSPKPSSRLGRGTQNRNPPPWRLRRLDPRAFGTRCSAPRF